MSHKYVELFNLAISTESEAEALACLRKIRKQSKGKARLKPGSANTQSNRPSDGGYAALKAEMENYKYHAYRYRDLYTDTLSDYNQTKERNKQALAEFEKLKGRFVLWVILSTIIGALIGAMSIG